MDRNPYVWERAGTANPQSYKSHLSFDDQITLCGVPIERNVDVDAQGKVVSEASTWSPVGPASNKKRPICLTCNRIDPRRSSKTKW